MVGTSQVSFAEWAFPEPTMPTLASKGSKSPQCTHNHPLKDHWLSNKAVLLL
jgi:hypothetical protein